MLNAQTSSLTLHTIPYLCLYISITCTTDVFLFRPIYMNNFLNSGHCSPLPMTPVSLMVAMKFYRQRIIITTIFLELLGFSAFLGSIFLLGALLQRYNSVNISDQIFAKMSPSTNCPAESCHIKQSIITRWSSLSDRFFILG